MYSFPFADTQFEAYVKLVRIVFKDLNTVFEIWKKSTAMKITSGKNLRITEPTHNNVREDHHMFNFHRVMKNLDEYLFLYSQILF